MLLALNYFAFFVSVTLTLVGGRTWLQTHAVSSARGLERTRFLTHVTSSENGYERTRL
jgi:hypothetical protein